MINKKRLVALTQNLIRIDSQNPPGNEVKIADFIKKDLISIGLDIKIHTFKPNRPNVIATLRGSAPDAKKESILISPHMDTVPTGKGWSVDPFGGLIKNGRIYGRGATDDKGNLACCMEVLRSLVEEDFAPKKNIVLAATADEETGSHQGIVPLLKKKILKNKMALIMDSDDFRAIVAQKGLIHSRIQISGKKAHGAYNWRGVNAIEIAGRVIGHLKNHHFAFKKHRFLHAPTVNIGTITGGDKVNIVADFCEFSADIRYLPGMNPKDILNQVRKLVEKETTKYTIKIDDLQYPYEINDGHLLVKLFLKSCRKLKLKAGLMGSEGATVISFFKKAGIPAIATGFGTSETAHITDEHVKIDDLYNGSRVLEDFLKEYDRA